MFSTFLAVIKDHESFDVSPEEITTNRFTRSVNEQIIFSEWDLEYLTCFEKIQYPLYRDANFFSKCFDNIIIILDDNVKQLPHLKAVFKIIEKHNSKIPLILFVGEDKYVHHDPFYSISLSSPKWFFMLPKMAKMCLTISSSLFPAFPPLSRIDSASIFYHCSQYDRSTPEETRKHIDVYGRILVSKFSHMDLYPNLKVYMIPPYYEDHGHNPYSFVHKKITIVNTLYIDNQDKIDRFCNENNYQCIIHRPATHVRNPHNSPIKTDFVIDLSEDQLVIDPKEYSFNGVITILKKKHETIHHLINGVYVDSIDAALNSIHNFYESLHLVKQFKIYAKSIHSFYNKDFVLSIWKEHLTYDCPYKNKNPKNNILLLYNFVYGYLEKNFEKINSIKTNCTSDYQVVLIDNRESPLSLVSVMITLSNLKKEFWGCKIYTSSKAMPFYKKYLEHIAEIVHCEELDVDGVFHIDMYNSLLKTSKFWRSLNAKKCLIIQNDGFIVREGAENYLKYDYVGAPWADAPDNKYLKEKVNSEMVGNGGLSIRNISKMIEITETYLPEKNHLFFHNLIYTPEDVYFCKCLQKINRAILLDTTTACFLRKKFSISNL